MGKTVFEDGIEGVALLTNFVGLVVRLGLGVMVVRTAIEQDLCAFYFELELCKFNELFKEWLVTTELYEFPIDVMSVKKCNIRYLIIPFGFNNRDKMWIKFTN